VCADKHHQDRSFNVETLLCQAFWTRVDSLVALLVDVFVTSVWDFMSLPGSTFIALLLEACDVVEGSISLHPSRFLCQLVALFCCKGWSRSVRAVSRIPDRLCSKWPIGFMSIPQSMIRTIIAFLNRREIRIRTRTFHIRPIRWLHGLSVTHSTCP